MAKTTNIFRIILFLCIGNSLCLHTSCVNESKGAEVILSDTLLVKEAPQTPVVEYTPEYTPDYIRVKDSYTSQIGVREATGHNDGKDVEKYLRATGLGKGYPWCAAFVRWNFDQSDVKTTITAWAPSAHNAKYIIYKSLRFNTEPRQGDVVTFWYPNLGRIGHTGFFDYRVNDRVYESVEGNTNGQGSREGNGVYRKRRSFKATYTISRWTKDL